MKMSNARKIIRQFKVLVETLPVDAKVIDLALDCEFKDLEDAIQYYCALGHDVRIIITRNQKDYKHSNIPVLSAKEYLDMNV